MATESEYNSYKALKARSPQACEICDQVFNNRFSSIVHNSSHIIIPLLKHQVHQCEICYFYFTSTDDFNTHMTEKHPPVISNYNNDIKFDIKVPQIELKKLPQLNRYNTFKIKEEIFDGDEFHSSSEDESLHNMVTRETERKCIKDAFENEEEYTDFIKSKLKFEVDEDYGLRKEYPTDCVTYNNNKKIITNYIVYEEPIEEFEFEKVILPEVPLKSDDKYESVHHTDLMSFKILNCKYCCVWFSNRFSLIVHETTHMRINKSRIESSSIIKVCDDTCGLLYTNNSKQIGNYISKIHEPLQQSKKKTVKDLVEPVQESVQKSERIEKSFTIKVCDHCYSFFKNSIKKIYILKETVSYTTERPCHECKQKFFNLKTVKTITRINKMCQINRGSDRRRYTNEKRLRNIQIRLKMINKFGI